MPPPAASNEPRNPQPNGRLAMTQFLALPVCLPFPLAPPHPDPMGAPLPSRGQPEVTGGVASAGMGRQGQGWLGSLPARFLWEIAAYGPHPGEP